jgi:predicted permease
MLRDVRLAIRRFWFKPWHTALMIVIVGLGIGAATAVFSVVDQTILRPPPFAHADRLVEVLDLFRSSGARSTNLTPEKIAGWQEQRALFEALEGYMARQVDLTAEQGEPERLRGLVVTTGLFRMLGVQPVIGRDFVEGDGRPGGERVVMIGETLWRHRFGGQPQVLGTEISLNDQKHTIIGVMPRRFRLTGEDEHLWVPVDVRVPGMNERQNFLGIGRLARGVHPGSEQQLADTLASRMQALTPLPDEPFWDVSLARKTVSHVPDTTRTALFVLLGAVGFVLLITCANTASLFLSQVGIRERETAIRSAIGASRGRLFREVLTESVLLAACGGGVGILLATWGVDAIVAAAPPNLTFSATSPIEVDARVLSIAAAMTFMTGLIFGVVPALRGSAPNVEMILKSGSGGGRGRTPDSRLSGALVVAEVAFSLILLVGSALMVRTFVNLHALEPGFNPEGVMAVSLSLPTDKYVGEGSQAAFLEALRERLRGVQGVSDVAVAAGVFGGAGIYFGKVEEVEGRTPSAALGRIEVALNNVSPDYFRTLGIPVAAGRIFTQTDEQDGVLISRSLANRLWPNGEAVGRRFRLDTSHPWETIVGVVGDVESRAGDLGTSLHMYHRFVPPSATPGVRPLTRGYAERVVIVRAADPTSIIPAIRAAVWSIDPHQPVERIVRVADIYADAFARERFVLQLMTAFGVIALVLTAAGIFGVLSQMVARRTREIGVRVALGARPADIVRLVLVRGLMLLVIGAAVGLAGALGLSRSIKALLFQVPPLDPASFASVTLVMMGIALLACWQPTRRAIQIEPAVALKME